MVSSARSMNRTDTIRWLTLSLVTESAHFDGNKGAKRSVPTLTKTPLLMLTVLADQL